MTSILIVENHTELRKMIKELLKKHRKSLEIIETGTGKKGISQAVVHRPDIVLLDIVLPDMDGITVARKIKKEVRESKIILLKMFVTKNVIEVYKPSFVKAIIGKNEIFEKLISIIEKYSKKTKRWDGRNRKEGKDKEDKWK